MAQINSVPIDCGSIVKEIADSPRKIFVDRGGRFYDLENFKAANYTPQVYNILCESDDEGFVNIMPL